MADEEEVLDPVEVQEEDELPGEFALVPPDVEGPPDDELADASESSDLVIEDTEPEPLGKSWAFDFGAGRFLLGGNTRGPAATRDLQTLRYWIEKCLMTTRGSHPVHPPTYGIQPLPYGSDAHEMVAGLRETIEETLTFHPWITKVRNFTAEIDDNEEFVSISFTVVTLEDDELAIRRLILGTGTW